MSFLSSPKLLFFVRIAQFLFALAFLVLLAWSSENRGYWTNLTGPITLGVVTVLFTWGVTGHAFWVYFRQSGAGLGKAVLMGRLITEFILFLMWIGSASLMLRPVATDYGLPAIPAPPFVEWDLDIAVAFVEIVSFALTMVLLFIETRSKGSGGTTASYV